MAKSKYEIFYKINDQDYLSHGIEFNKESEIVFSFDAKASKTIIKELDCKGETLAVLAEDISVVKIK
jgi:hypothetical protein